MPQIVDHVFTPAHGAAGPTTRCIACPAPEREHLDEAVIAAYAVVRAHAGARGDSVQIAIDCGHLSAGHHPASSVWDHPDDGVYCSSCDRHGAMALLDQAA